MINPNSNVSLSSTSALAMSEIIPYKELKFVIMHCPDDVHSAWTISKLIEFKIHHVFRLCEQSYDVVPYNKNDIEIHDEIKFQDGGIPSKEQVKTWLQIVDTLGHETIAVHCVSGIGRAPVMVALAFIHKGMDPLECIEHIRKYRRRALNNVQINYLSEFEEKKPCCPIQ